MTTNSVPRFLILKSVYNNTYLSYMHEDGVLNRYLKFSGKEIVSPYVKYEVEKAKTGNGLVHLRCCYSNKYWVMESQKNYYIVAGANEPEEDQSKWSCTLFEPLFIDAKTVRFRHAHSQRYACLWRSGPPYTSCLYAGATNTDGNQCDVYQIVDWESLTILPKHIAFKGDNGNYLSARTIEGHPYHQFTSDDIGDPTVGYEVFATPDGSIHIKSNLFGKFWRRSSDWIWADSEDSTANNSDTLFWPIKVDNNAIALRNLANNNFCKRLTTVGKTSCLNAGISTISKEARIQVEELVISRNIYYVDFHLMHARIYNQTVFTMAFGSATNKTQEPSIVEVKLSFTETKSSTWNSNVSLKLGVNSAIQTGIPVIMDGKIKISDEFTGVYQWGKTELSTNTVETFYKVALPPMTMVRVNLVATKGSCDVPFSYSQTDTLINGERITYDMDDGVYTGINYFNLKYETKQEAL